MVRVMRVVVVVMVMVSVMRRIRKARTGKKQHRRSECNYLDHDSSPAPQKVTPSTLSIALRGADGECHLAAIRRRRAAVTFKAYSSSNTQQFDKASEGVSYKPV
jgi:hypothetical protein